MRYALLLVAALAACSTTVHDEQADAGVGGAGVATLSPCPPDGVPDTSCSPGCDADEWCYAEVCNPRQGAGDPTGCWLGHNLSCLDGLYCSYATGECESYPRTDCSDELFVI